MEAARLAEQYGGIREARLAVARLQAELVAMEDRRYIYFDTPTIAENFRDAIGGMPEERFAAIFLDNNKKQIGGMVVYDGGSTTKTIMYPRRLFRDALARDATGIVLCHNHPSGCITASANDRDLTRRLETTAASLEIHLIDHIIVTRTDWMSFQNAGLI